MVRGRARGGKGSLCPPPPPPTPTRPTWSPPPPPTTLPSAPPPPPPPSPLSESPPHMGQSAWGRWKIALHLAPSWLNFDGNLGSPWLLVFCLEHKVSTNCATPVRKRPLPPTFSMAELDSPLGVPVHFIAATALSQSRRPYRCWFPQQSSTSCGDGPNPDCSWLMVLVGPA